MPSELPTGFQEGKIYLIKGSTMKKLIAAIQSRTPLPQDPLYTGEESADGVQICAPHFDMVVCVDDGAEGFLEKRADVLGGLAGEGA